MSWNSVFILNFVVEHVQFRIMRYKFRFARYRLTHLRKSQNC